MPPQQKQRAGLSSGSDNKRARENRVGPSCEPASPTPSTNDTGTSVVMPPGAVENVREDESPDETRFWALISSFRRHANPGYLVDIALSRVSGAPWRSTRHYNCIMRAGPKSDAPRIMMALRGDPTLNPDEYTYLLLAEACAHMGWTHDVRSSIAMMRQQDGIQPGVKMFNYLLAVYAREGDVHNTEAVFREITTTEGLQPTAHTYMLLIKAYGKGNMTEKMRAKFDEMRAAGVQPDKSTYMAMISSYAAAGSVRMAGWVLNVMRRNGFDPEECHYTQMANAFVVSNDVDGCQRYYDSLEANGTLSRLGEPAILFNMLLKAHANVGDHATIARLIERRRAQRLPMDAKMMSMLIQAYVAAGQMASAEEVLENMDRSRKKSMAPNVVSYTMLINGYGKKGDLDSAEGMLGRMTAAGVQPNYYTFTSLAIWNMRHGRLEQASRYLMEALQLGERQTRTNKVVMLALLELYGRHKNYSEMISLWEKLCDMGCFPSLRQKEGVLDLHTLNEFAAKLTVISELRRIRKDVRAGRPPKTALTIVTGRGLRDQLVLQSDESRPHSASAKEEESMLRRAVREILGNLGISANVPANNPGCFVVSTEELKRLGRIDPAECLRIGGMAPMVLHEESWALFSRDNSDALDGAGRDTTGTKHQGVSRRRRKRTSPRR